MSKKNRDTDKVEIVADNAAASMVDEVQLLADVRGLILVARGRVALYLNQETTLLYWDVGERIRRDVLGFERAPYGQQVVENIGKDLTREFGPG